MKRKALLFPVHMIPPSAKAGAFNPGAAEAAPPHLVVTESEDALRFGSHDASSKLPCVNHVDHLVAQGSTGLRNMLPSVCCECSRGSPPLPSSRGDGAAVAVAAALDELWRMVSSRMHERACVRGAVLNSEQ